MSWFTRKKKPVEVLGDLSKFSVTLSSTESPSASRLPGDGEIVVKRENYYKPRENNSYLYFGEPETYKSAYADASKLLERYQQFLEDLLVLDPKFAARFNAEPLTKKGKKPKTFVWDFTAAHGAADVVRSDADEKVKRDALKKFQGK